MKRLARDAQVQAQAEQRLANTEKKLASPTPKRRFALCNEQGYGCEFHSAAL